MDGIIPMRNSFVGWVGGLSSSDALELSIELARSIGMMDSIELRPNLVVTVSFLEYVPIARRVDVEPCTPGNIVSRILYDVFIVGELDDWEIIELHAEQLEQEILRQISVIFPHQQAPIWVNPVCVV